MRLNCYLKTKGANVNAIQTKIRFKYNQIGKHVEIIANI